MAKGASASRSEEVTLEPSDLELRNPTVVMSVRLDNDTARRLHATASTRGMKVSELLREAANYYLNAGGVPADKYIVTGKDVTRLAIGGASARYETPSAGQVDPRPAIATWGEPQPLRVIPAPSPAHQSRY